MTLPITLAIIQSLLVVVGRHRFAVPLNSVLETLIIDRGEIQRSQDRELFDLRGDALPLRRLAVELGIADAPLEEKPYVVVVGVGDHRIGLLVDRLDGQQDTVIKSIQGPVRAIRGIAGATEVGDRNPVLVIDVAAFVEGCRARKGGRVSQRPGAEETSGTPAWERLAREKRWRRPRASSPAEGCSSC